MAIVLGNTPEDLTVYVTKDSAFNCTLEAQTPAGAPVPFPTGTLVYLLFSGGRWNATVSGNQAIFAQSAATVNTLISWGKHQQVSLYYENATTKIVWAHGKMAIV